MVNLICTMIWALAFISHLDYEKNFLTMVQLVVDGYLVLHFFYQFVIKAPPNIVLLLLAIGELIVLTISDAL